MEIYIFFAVNAKSKAKPKKSLLHQLNGSNMLVRSQERRNCELKGNIGHEFPDQARAIDVYEAVLSFDVLTELIVLQSNLYAQQSGRKAVGTL